MSTVLERSAWTGDERLLVNARVKKYHFYLRFLDTFVPAAVDFLSCQQ